MRIVIFGGLMVAGRCDDGRADDGEWAHWILGWGSVFNMRPESLRGERNR
jgi:hypothetical protein